MITKGTITGRATFRNRRSGTDRRVKDEFFYIADDRRKPHIDRRGLEVRLIAIEHRKRFRRHVLAQR